MLRNIVVALIALVSAAATAQAQNGASMARGKYLVDTVMTCHNCHTPRGPNGLDFDKQLSGGLRFNEPPFDVTASNITSDKETGIGAWSVDDIKKFLTSGVRPNGVPVANVMPTGFYKVLTARDLDAIATYLHSVPPVKNQVPAPVYKIPLPQTFVPYGQQPMKEADFKDKVKHGLYLATIAHCMECHSPLGPKGRDFTRMGAGGFELKGPWGVSVSRNITSSKTKGLGGWTDAEIKRAITQGISRDGSKLKPPMGFAFYAKMTPDDLDAIVAYLRTVPAME
ncbi:MAG TPA: c-type cytochrome [Xanthobacteraceae bacterium]|nr:c-type cytochrome [Xanthobacteraceae bacterium]